MIDFYNLETGLLAELPESCLYTWNNQGQAFENPGSTYFGFVYQGKTKLITGEKEFNLYESMYFSCDKPFRLLEGSQGFLVESKNFRGQFLIGGPVENKGRYAYIDGCSDSLLIPPVFKGDPCFNLLHFPENITQTRHTHPSARIGMILQGNGFCNIGDKELELFPGLIFVLAPEIVHGFKTTGNEMLLVVYHPDSDFGPTDTNHPMINMTIVNGVSASVLSRERA